MKYRLIAFDLDGTALHSDRQMSERLRDACRRAEEKGVLTVVCSGRIYRSTLRYSQFLGVTSPVINCQGGIICDGKSGEVLYSRPLEESMMHDAVSFFREHDHFVQATTNDDFYYEDEDAWSSYYGSLQGFDGIRVNDLTRDLPQLPAKVVGLADPDVTQKRFEQAKARFGDSMQIAISVPWLLEFTHPLANKGEALRWLGERYGIAPQEMIAVGDSLNDLPMLRFAGLGAAVKNARDEVLREADVVVESNDDDGVAKLIEREILREDLSIESDGQHRRICERDAGRDDLPRMWRDLLSGEERQPSGSSDRGLFRTL